MGFEMAISKLVAANRKSSDNAGLYYLISGILMSVIISVVITVIVFTNSDYIARRLLEIDSKENQGSTFRVVFPKDRLDFAD